jgi:hypothetical protein
VSYISAVKGINKIVCFFLDFLPALTKFDTDLHVMPASNFEFRENPYGERHTLLRGLHKILTYF